MSERRRLEILQALRASARPMTGLELAAAMNVSRQIIVQDVALLRAHGDEVVATPQGYVLAERLAAVAPRKVLACRHDREHAEDELMTMVDFGLRVIDVVVEHPIYGELRGILNLASRDDVATFVRRLKESGASLLSALTNGVHLHMVEAQRSDALARAVQSLHAKGYLLLTDEREEAVLSIDKTAKAE